MRARQSEMRPRTESALNLFVNVCLICYSPSQTSDVWHIFEGQVTCLYEVKLSSVRDFFKACLKRSAILSALTSEWNLNFFVTKRNSTKPKWRNVWRSKAQTLELRNRTFTGSWSSPTPRRLFPSQFCSADLEPGRRQITHSFTGVCMNLPGFTSRFSLCIRLGYFRGADTWQCKNSPPALMNWTHLSYKRPSES